MKIDFEKIGIIASFFADNTSGLYVTKLLKLFYYLDFVSYKLRGAPVTNDVYFKLPYGPVPSAIKNELDILSSKNILGDEFKSQLSSYIQLQPDSDGNGNKVVAKKNNYNLRKLSNTELEIMRELASEFKNTKAKSLSNQTHREKPWLSTSENSVIVYELADDLDISKVLPKLKTK